MANVNRYIILAAMSLLVSACGPRLTFHTDDTSLQQSPPSGSVTFALRTSNITLSAPSPVGGGGQTDTGAPQAPATDKSQPGPKPPTPAPAEKPQPSAKPSTPTPKGSNTQSDPSKQTPLTPKEVCAGREWTQCLLGIGVAVTPESHKSHIYTAVPHNFLNLLTTELSATTVDGDDLLPKVVSVSYRNRTKDVIAAAGAGAAAGAPPGPYGIAAGTAAGLLSGFLASEVPHARFAKEFVCATDIPTNAGILTPDNVQLLLPVTISLDVTLQPNGSDANTTPDGKQCWHLLPQNLGIFNEQYSDDQTPQYGGTGWFYRIRLDSVLPSNSQPAASFFGTGTATGVKTGFPFSACRKAALDIVWWKELQRALDTNAKTPSYKYQTMSVTLADPTIVGVAPLPKVGDIQFHTLCGASTTFGKDTNPTLADTIDAALQAIKQVKDAQSAAQPKTSPANATPSNTKTPAKKISGH